MQNFKHNVVLIFLLCCMLSFCQDFSKNAISIGVSPFVFWEDSTNDGLGSNLSIGFERTFKNNRLKLSPIFSIGSYNSKGIDDAQDLQVSSYTLRSVLNYDTFRINRFSVFIGGGLALNYSSGLSRIPGYFNNTNIGVSGLLGLRLTPNNDKFKYELLLFDFNSTSNFKEFSLLKFQLIVHF